MTAAREKLLEHERGIVAGTLANNDYYDESHLSPDDFTDPKLRRVWEVVGQIVLSGGHADPITVWTWPDSGIDPAYVSEISGYVGNTAYHVERAREHSAKRKLSHIAAIIRDGLHGKTSIDIIEDINREIDAIEDRGGDGTRALRDYLVSAVGEIEEAYNRHKAGDEVGGITTGYPSLDRLTDGFQNGEYNLIAARTGIGKTQFMNNLIENQAVKKAVPTGIFTLEMKGARLTKRQLVVSARLQYSRVRSGVIKESDFHRLQEAGDKLYNAPIWINNTPGMRFRELRSEARRMVRRGVKIIYVDYIGLIESGGRGASTYERVGEVSKGFQRLALELNIPFVVLAQLNRVAEGQVPTLANLRDSGQLEQDADLILFLHRDRGDSENATRLIIGKGRDTDAETLYFRFLKEYGRYEEAAFDT